MLGGEDRNGGSCRHQVIVTSLPLSEHLSIRTIFLLHTVYTINRLVHALSLINLKFFLNMHLHLPRNGLLRIDPIDEFLRDARLVLLLLQFVREVEHALVYPR